MNYDELLAPAAKSMRPSGIRKFFDLAAEMPHCISLGVGEPDFKTPWTIRDAGIRSLEQGRTRYTANAGIKELRAEICRYLARRMELNYQPSEVLVTVGGSEAIDLTIRALVKPGDEVIIPEPCFVCYEPITSLTGGVPVHIATKVEDDFRLRADLWVGPPHQHCHTAGHERTHHRSERLLKSVCHDRLAPGICGWSGTGNQGDDQNSPELHYVGPHHQPVCSYRSATFLR